MNQYEGEWNGIKYRAEPDASGECHRCIFFGKIPCIDKPPCTARSREDRTESIYVEVTDEN